MPFAAGTRGYTKAIVAAQMLAQIGAFALPALLPDYIDRWDLPKTEAGWLVGIFFAAYVVMVPVLVALTDRVPVRRVYMLGTSPTTLSHLGFALFADGFWSALLLRLLAGMGWAGTYKELALAGITTIAAANRWLAETYWPAHNAAFAVAPAETGSAFVADRSGRVRDILCIQEERRAGNDNAVEGRGLAPPDPAEPV
jgi:MFS family permease